MFWKKKTNTIGLRAFHISGAIHTFYLDIFEFSTTFEKERQGLDNLITESREVVKLNPNFPERDLIVEFGHARIRLNDYSAFRVFKVED